MKKLNFNRPLVDLSGDQIKLPDGTHQNLGRLLGNTLVSQADGDIWKYYGWGKAAHSGKDVEVDKSDEEKLRKFIEENKTISILAKAQLLECFEQPSLKERLTANKVTENGVES